MTGQTALGGRISSQAPVPTAEQADLADLVRDLVRRHAGPAPGPSDAPGTREDGLWQRLAGQVGVAGLGVPEQLGGAGGTYLDCHLVLAELGRGVVPGPYLATVLAGQELLAAVRGDGPEDGPGEGTLRALAGGAVTATVLTGDLTATGPDQVDGWLLHGRAGLVLEGGAAEVLLARVVTDEGPVLFELVAPGEQSAGAVTTVVRPTMDRALHLAEVTLTGARACRIGAISSAQAARLDALRPVAATAVQTGGSRRCLELTVEYLRTRTQFGRPLASFQALKHRLADLLVLVETADSASWGAAAAWAEGAEDGALLAAVAGAYCGEAYRAVAAETVQLHGGIAITWEHEAHRHLKQAHSMATLFGTPAGHRARLIEELGLRAARG